MSKDAERIDATRRCYCYISNFFRPTTRSAAAAAAAAAATTPATPTAAMVADAGIRASTAGTAAEQQHHQQTHRGRSAKRKYTIAAQLKNQQQVRHQRKANKQKVATAPAVEVGAAVGNSSGRDIGSGGGSETANERGMSGESWCRSTLKDP